jgi:uncharacterized protein (TIGR03083 family)
MTDDTDLAGLDPYDLMATELRRLDRHFTSLRDAEWEQPTRCAGWNVRDVLAHMASSEGYNRAGLDGTVSDFLAAIAARGATDLASANEIGIRSYDDVTTEEVLAEWRRTSRENLEGFRSRDGGEVDTSVGAYPTRWQAFHLAFELATHADDVAAPVAPAEVQARNGWQAAFGRFALKEAKPGVQVEARDGETHVRLEDVDVVLPDEEFVQALAARVPADGPLDEKTRAALSVTP